jgi:hypothetical protein
MLGLGDTVYGKWTLEEFNSVHQTVTLHNGDKILTIRRGERHPLTL